MNRDLWDRASGEEISADDLLDRIMGSHVDGVTYIGGEPLQQGEDLLTLSALIRQTGLDIVLFTGYEPEEFDELQQSIADLASVVIAGRYVESERDTYLTHRGSSNQRVIVKDGTLKRFYSEEVRQVEVIITEDSETYLGFPEDFLNDDPASSRDERNGAAEDHPDDETVG